MKLTEKNAEIQSETEEAEMVEKEIDYDEMEEKEYHSEAKSTYYYGTVVKCNKVNIRKTPETVNGNVISTAIEKSRVRVYPEESTNDFYKICTASGIEGYCMKTYIAIDNDR